MKVRLKGDKIVLSQVPQQDVEGAFLVKSKDDFSITDAVEGQKQYDLPEGFTRENITAVYLRVL